MCLQEETCRSLYLYFFFKRIQAHTGVMICTCSSIMRNFLCYFLSISFWYTLPRAFQFSTLFQFFEIAAQKTVVSSLPTRTQREREREDGKYFPDNIWKKRKRKKIILRLFLLFICNEMYSLVMIQNIWTIWLNCRLAENAFNFKHNSLFFYFSSNSFLFGAKEKEKKNKSVASTEIKQV